MRILTEEEILSIFSLSFCGSSCERYLSFYTLPENNEQTILDSTTGVSLSDILYSKYYWFLKFKQENENVSGKDSGYDQQAYGLMMSIYEDSRTEAGINCLEAIYSPIYC